MGTNEKTVNAAPTNRYRSGFVILAVCIFATVYFARIHEMGGFFKIQDILHPPRHIVGYFFCILPFLILSLMAIKWALQNRNFTKHEFVCHVLGILPIYLAYLYIARYMAALAATAPGELIGVILYPLSTPLIPILFKISYAICQKEYMLFYPDATFTQAEIHKNDKMIASSPTTLKEMFQKHREENASRK